MYYLCMCVFRGVVSPQGYQCQGEFYSAFVVVFGLSESKLAVASDGLKVT